MNAIFLSASVPSRKRAYYETAEPFLIQAAVRELVMAVRGKYRLVFGGHPAITPMVQSICEDVGADYSDSVVLYQSKFFEDQFPDENERFKNVVHIDAVPGARESSLRRMRLAMLSREDLGAAVFIGGMEGIREEYLTFRQLHPHAKVLSIAAPGGAARDLSVVDHMGAGVEELEDVNFAALFYRELRLEDDDEAQKGPY
jgi:hypothetical protein